MKISREKYYKVFASCKVVKGSKRAIICDLQRNDIYPIPLSLYDILMTDTPMTFNNLLAELGPSNEAILIEYFTFLVEKEIIFFTNTPELYPDMSDEWDEPYSITNCIIDLDNFDHLDQIQKCIGELAIKALQVRIYTQTTLNNLEKILTALRPNGLTSLELIMKFGFGFDDKDILDLMNRFPYISTVKIYDAPKDYYIDCDRGRFGLIFFTTKSISSHKDCGVVNSEFFVINTKMFTESQNYNSCLNRKISIDRNGDIKNCPSMIDSFGNIGDIRLIDVLKIPAFKSLWNLDKGKIDVCKDCEFRFICTDCRAYVDDPEDIKSKPLKCGYNPYTSEWNDWTTNPMKQATIDHYGLNPLILS